MPAQSARGIFISVTGGKGGTVAVISSLCDQIVARFLATCIAILALSNSGVGQSFGQDDAIAAKISLMPTDWPWTAWQRGGDGVERWPELDSAGLKAYRQLSSGLDGSAKGSVFFVISPLKASDQNERQLSSIELPRLDNVVERVWWWPLNDKQATSPHGGLLADVDYRMPFVPPQKRLMKLTQTPSRWTLSYNDAAEASLAMAAGGIVVMDVRDQPQWNETADRIQAGKDGVIVMPASKAKVFGKQLQFEPLPHKNTVGYWVNADDYATWKIDLPAAGDYNVHILQGCGGGQGGSRISLAIGDVAVETTVEETGHFQNFRWRDLGPIKLQAASDIDVSLRCVTKAKAAVMDVRQIRLVPSGAKMPIDDREVAADFDLPPLSHESPGPGRRSIRQAAIVDGSQAYHLLALPSDWNASRKYPVLVEWTGNGPYENDRGDRSSGRVEDARLASGLAGGDGAIVLSLPFLNDAGTANVTKWWGDAPDYRPDATLEYAKAAIDEVCEKFGGDRSKLVLVGFSRGAIACNAVGLSNDDAATWWRGFVCFSHYDGVRPWPPTGDESASLSRLARLGNRPQLILSEASIGDAASNSQQTMQYFQRHSIDTQHLLQLDTGFVNHSDAWAMRPCHARTVARQWLKDAVMKD
ncbi:MAG TPA: hypothetical protein DDZ51_24335 [Planctomycetaceae bacterium]|nr:hypothetical protein [Planctomycetaceae bacterium]